ncbi:MAG: esterase-like activity of phytase family protein [Phycisphaeraceae bacterium]|nr:esterase-like activity of phytase family protein [Phycisphaeraceae bacterium]
MNVIARTSIPIALLAAIAGTSAGAPLAIEFKSGVTVGSSATDQNGVGFTVGGMSGIVRIVGDEYAAIQNNSNKIVRLHISLAADGSIVTASIKPGVGGGLTLSQTGDFEDIAFPGIARNIVRISEEGSPEIRAHDYSTGAYVATAPRPAIYANRRSNFGFESCTLGRTQWSMWTCNEEALTVDGALSTSSAGTLVRILKYSNDPPMPVAEFAYLTDPVHGVFVTGSRSGVSQIVALPNGKLLVLERSFALGASFYQTRIYEVDVSSATNVIGFPTLVGATYTAASKRQLYKGDQTNLEGLCLGTSLAAGGYALLGVVDDDDPISVNRIVAFRLTGDVDSACPADLNEDGVVDDADFVRFAQSYDLLLDPVGDLNLDDATDDQDFVLFAGAYNELLCP